MYVKLKAVWVELTPDVNTLWHVTVGDEPDGLDVWPLHCGKRLRAIEVETTKEPMPVSERCRGCFINVAKVVAERIATYQYDEAVAKETALEA